MDVDSVGVSTCKEGIEPLLVISVNVGSVYFLYEKFCSYCVEDLSYVYHV